MKAVITKTPDGRLQIMLPYSFSGSDPKEILEKIDNHPISKYITDEQFEDIAQDLEEVHSIKI